MGVHVILGILTSFVSLSLTMPLAATVLQAVFAVLQGDFAVLQAAFARLLGLVGVPGGCGKSCSDYCAKKYTPQVGKQLFQDCTVESVIFCVLTSL